MIAMNKVGALYIKQMKNVSYNMFITVVFVMAPLFALIFSRLIPGTESMALPFGVLASAVLGASNTMCILIAEEKEKNTLNVLITSTVSAMDFLLSNILSTLTLTVIVNVIVYAICGSTVPFLMYLLITTFGSVAAIIFGAIIGIVSKNQMTASGIISPFALILMMIPIFSGLLPKLQKVSDVLFSQQMLNMLNDVSDPDVLLRGFLIIGANLVVFVIAFALVYKRVGLER